MFRKKLTLKSFFAKDLNRFYMYSLFASMGPFNILFLIYAQYLTNSYSIAGLLLSLKIIFSTVFKILLSSFKDEKELKILLAMAEGLCVFAQIFYTMAYFVNSALVIPSLCLGVICTGIGTALWQGSYKCFVYEAFEKDDLSVGSNPYSKSQSMYTIGRSIGAILATSIAGVYSYGLAMGLGIVTNSIAFGLTLTLKRVNRNCELGGNCKERGLKHFIKALVKIMKDKKLRYLFLAESSRSTINRTFNDFLKPFYITIMPVTFLGYFSTTKDFLMSLSYAFTDKLIRKWEYVKTMKICLWIAVFLSAIGIVIDNMLSPIFLIFKAPFLAPYLTAVEYTMQQNYSQNERVTMSSSIRIVSDLFQIPVVVVLGYLAQESTQLALLSLIPLYIIPALLFKKAFRVMKLED